MRTVRLCAIIAIGVAFGCAFDEATITKADNFAAKTVQAAIDSFCGE